MPTSERPAQSRAAITKAIALSERDVEDVKRLLELLLTDPREPEITPTQPVDTRSAAAALLGLRASRLEFFPRAMFGEPAWDLMLAIHASNDGARPTVTSLADRLRIPASSAARWARYLEAHGFVERQSDPNDARSHLIELTQKGYNQLELFIATGVSQQLWKRR